MALHAKTDLWAGVVKRWPGLRLAEWPCCVFRVPCSVRFWWLLSQPPMECAGQWSCVGACRALVFCSVLVLAGLVMVTGAGLLRAGHCMVLSWLRSCMWIVLCGVLSASAHCRLWCCALNLCSRLRAIHDQFDCAPPPKALLSKRRHDIQTHPP